MDSFPERMSERFMAFIVGIMKLERQLCKSFSGRHIYGQLFRSGTSSGANFEEARAAESKADFVHKMQIVLKELRESHFWTKLIISSGLIHSEVEVLKFLKDESKELSNITAKSIVTAKAKIRKPDV
jgi:four helix bundle protein